MKKLSFSSLFAQLLLLLFVIVWIAPSFGLLISSRQVNDFIFLGNDTSVAKFRVDSTESETPKASKRSTTQIEKRLHRPIYHETETNFRILNARTRRSRREKKKKKKYRRVVNGHFR